jgi:hypothetical protein
LLGQILEKLFKEVFLVLMVSVYHESLVEQRNSHHCGQKGERERERERERGREKEGGRGRESAECLTCPPFIPSGLPAYGVVSPHSG